MTRKGKRQVRVVLTASPGSPVKWSAPAEKTFLEKAKWPIWCIIAFIAGLSCSLVAALLGVFD